VVAPLRMPSPGVDAPESVDASHEKTPSDPELKVELPTDAAVIDHAAEIVVSSLDETISTGGYELDSMLQSISEAARKLTGATGAAIAMWKDGAVVCRGSCGANAPPLGAKLSVESGISGHCLRSGLIQHCGETLNDPRVDAELCRQLGLRSVAVLPIRGWRGVNGILEVFSTEPRAFAEQHFELLEKLAGLAERARAGQPDAEAVAAKPAPEEVLIPNLLPASDRVRDLAALLLGSKKTHFVLGAIALLGLLLLGFAMWLGWRNPDGVKAKTNTLPTVPAQPVSASLSDNDPVWKLNPGGQILLTSKSERTPLRTAAKEDAMPATKASRSHTPSGEDAGPPETVIRHLAPSLSRPADSVAVDPPPLVSSVANPATLDTLLSASRPAPQLAAVPISQGVSEGYLIHRVNPVYPAQAKMTRLQGNVVLAALIAEDGSVQDLKVVTGQPTLARAALQAVRQWRYKPYELNRKPVKMNTTITVQFKLP
jgi:TonB family protein